MDSLTLFIILTGFTSQRLFSIKIFDVLIGIIFQCLLFFYIIIGFIYPLSSKTFWNIYKLCIFSFFLF